MQKGFKQVNLEGCVSGTLAVPVIGENGNWFIGNDDTGVCAKGSGAGCGDGTHYSTEEQVIGTWIDGSVLYRKTISFGALPNANVKSVANDIADLDFMVNLSVVAKSTSGDFVSIPHVVTGATSSNMSVWASTTDLTIRTAANYSHYTICFFTLEYTKTNKSV